jgi:hypothetical protein
MKRPLFSGVILTIFALFIFAAPSAATTLWYNGDMNRVDAWTNGTYVDGPGTYTAKVYDDFVVPAGGWHVTDVWSNNLLDGTFSQAQWSILSGVVAGIGGTVVASGTGNVTPVATGRSLFGYNEYTVQVSGLNIDLAPNRYWLNVAPIGAAPGTSGFFYAANTTTSGANAVGNPPGNNDNAFYDDPNSGFTFATMATVEIDLEYPPGTFSDFSMGIAGNPVPLPGAVWLLGSGLGLLAWGRSRRRS